MSLCSQHPSFEKTYKNPSHIKAEGYRIPRLEYIDELGDELDESEKTKRR